MLISLKNLKVKLCIIKDMTRLEIQVMNRSVVLICLISQLKQHRHTVCCNRIVGRYMIVHVYNFQEQSNLEMYSFSGGHAVDAYCDVNVHRTVTASLFVHLAVMFNHSQRHSQHTGSILHCFVRAKNVDKIVEEDKYS